MEELYDLLDSKLLMSADDKDAYSVYYFCILNNVERAYIRFIEVLSRINIQKVPFSLGNKFKDILEKYGEDKKLTEMLKANGQLMRTIEGKDGKQKK